jgi:transposase
MMMPIGPQGLAITGVTSDGRRRYDPASKDRLVEACLEPGVSLAGLALQHGVNANLLRKWVEKRRQRLGQSGPPSRARLPEPMAFVRVETVPELAVPPAGGIAPHAPERVSSARLQASMPNGVRIPTKPSTWSNLKPSRHSDFKPSMGPR